MKNKQSSMFGFGFGFGFVGMVLVMVVVLLSSCGTFTKLTDAELKHRSKIDYEMKKAYNDYVLINDSLLIEYYKEIK
tara:strand:+ start:746 stop:976 length:231 start_codon:yes stop_codon:yes gene_type:complete